MGQPSTEKIIASRAAYATGYYAKQLELGQQFQDHIACQLQKIGVILVNYQSKKFQLEQGESLFGAEIKRDGRWRDTGNLYIEIAEKAHPDRMNYIPSGTRRNDNSWLYIIGDEEKAWIFSITMLRLLEEWGRYEGRTTPTSIGWLLPVDAADKYAAKIIENAAKQQPSASTT